MPYSNKNYLSRHLSSANTHSFELSSLSIRNLKFSTRITPIALSVASVFSLMFSASTFAKYDHSDVKSGDIETITVSGSPLEITPKIAAKVDPVSPDVSSWLESIAGANINSNGKVTGIAQYRGMYGDRVAVKLNGHSVIGAGPNAMDTPLSYSPSITTESLSVYRGIAPVSVAIESIGGAIEVENTRAKLSQSQNVETSTKLQSGYGSINDAVKLAAKTQFSTQTLAIMAYVDSSSANDSESGDGTKISPSSYEKIQSGIDVRWQATDKHLLGLTYDYTDTQEAGTPALPMDIASIFGHRFQVDGSYELNTGTLLWQLGYMNSDHVMDNYSERENMTMESYRKNTTDVESIEGKLVWQSQNLQNEHWEIGVEGYISEHNSFITNPNNQMFGVDNFNETEDQKLSVYGQWDNQWHQHQLTTGIRVTQVWADTEEVNHHMAMMNATVGDLMDAFNSADRSISDTNFDAVIAYQYEVDSSLTLSASLGRKERAPTYQERFLWVPMEATAGLADGNTYLGDINLDSEVSYQSNLGLSYQGEKLHITADLHYQTVDDYIQGTPSENMPAKMLAQMMMNDDNLLQFSNVEAEFYGLDAQLSYDVTPQWSIKALTSYVRGKRNDINDDLYRISPLKATLGLHYNTDNWLADINVKAVAEQDKVSITNQEQESSGYATLNMNMQYDGLSQLSIRAGIENLLDKEYQNHLGGYNRVNNVETPLMERLPSDGRNIWLGMSYQF